MSDNKPENEAVAKLWDASCFDCPKCGAENFIRYRAICTIEELCKTDKEKLTGTLLHMADFFRSADRATLVEQFGPDMTADQVFVFEGDRLEVACDCCGSVYQAEQTRGVNLSDYEEISEFLNDDDDDDDDDDAYSGADDDNEIIGESTGIIVGAAADDKNFVDTDELEFDQKLELLKRLFIAIDSIKQTIADVEAKTDSIINRNLDTVRKASIQGLVDAVEPQDKELRQLTISFIELANQVSHRVSASATLLSMANTAILMQSSQGRVASANPTISKGSAMNLTKKSVFDETARVVDTENQSINAADASRVLSSFFDVLAKKANEGPEAAINVMLFFQECVAEKLAKLPK